MSATRRHALRVLAGGRLVEHHHRRAHGQHRRDAEQLPPRHAQVIGVGLVPRPPAPSATSAAPTARAAPAPPSPRFRGPNSTSPRTLPEKIWRSGSWKHEPDIVRELRHGPARGVRDRRAATRPAVGRSRPLRWRTSVVLPLPFWPTSATALARADRQVDTVEGADARPRGRRGPGRSTASSVIGRHPCRIRPSIPAAASARRRRTSDGSGTPSPVQAAHRRARPRPVRRAPSPRRRARRRGSRSRARRSVFCSATRTMRAIGGEPRDRLADERRPGRVELGGRLVEDEVAAAACARRPAIATSCCWPPESRRGSPLRQVHRCRGRASASYGPLDESSRSTPRLAGPKATSSKTVSATPESWVAGSWKPMPTALASSMHRPSRRRPSPSMQHPARDARPRSPVARGPRRRGIACVLPDSDAPGEPRRPRRRASSRSTSRRLGSARRHNGSRAVEA